MGGAALAILWAIGGPDAWASDGASEAFEQVVRVELAAADPEALALLDQAEAAAEAGDLAAAGTAYATLADRLPGDDHSRRRHCLVLQELNLRDQALPRCEEALALRERPENRVALAMVLLDLPSGARRSEADLARAEEQLVLAAAESTEDPMIPRIRCHLASEREDAAGLAACLPDLERLAPDHVKTAWFSWQLAQMEGRTDEALQALDRAEAAGMPAEDAAAFRALTRAEGGEGRPWPLALGVGASLGAVMFWWLRPRGDHPPSSVG